MIKKLSIVTILILMIIYIFANLNKEESKDKLINSFSFDEVAVSKNENEKKIMRVSSAVKVKYDDDTTESFRLKYKKMISSGDSFNNEQFGRVTDKDGNAFTQDDGSVWISNNPDSNSIIKVKNHNYLITHFEERPGQLYKTELQLKNSIITPLSTEPIDFKEVGGTIINCAGSKTAWNTHIGGEEDYSLNTRYADKASPFYVECDKEDNSMFNGNDTSDIPNNFCGYVSAMQRYLKDDSITLDGYNGEQFTPYNYGYIIEVNIKENGDTEVAKHYVTGKYTPELAINMPDNKTFYMSDDGNAKALYKFVSDEPINSFNKNWRGTLYSAKLKQVSSLNGGSFEIDWIKLGDSSDKELKKIISRKFKLTDIFDIKADINGSCNSGYTKVYEDDEIECLKLKTGPKRSAKFQDDSEVKTAAAFLESRKYGGYLGATNEFNKEEGLTYDRDRNVIYIAISQIKKAMEDNYKAIETSNDIKLQKNACGGVYELTLDENYNATAMKPLVVGLPLGENEKYADEFFCSPESVSNPDNIAYLGSDLLLIGEDTTFHVNNFIWAYNTKTKVKTRIASLPIGAEVTGLANSNIGTKEALFVNIQHPFADNPMNVKGQKPNSHLLQNATSDEIKGSTGYIDGLPSGIFK